MADDQTKPWPPPKHLWPAGFTAHRDGWVRRWRGRMLHVCGKKVPLDQVEDRWAEKKKKLLGQHVEAPRRPAGTTTLVEAYSQFLQRQELRVKTGKPRPLAPRTLEDYSKTLDQFCSVIGPARQVGTLGPADGTRWVRWLTAGESKMPLDPPAPIESPKSCAASSLARAIAYVDAFCNWMWSAELVPAPINLGPDFHKPSNSALYDERTELAKAYSPAELRKIKKEASVVQLAWLYLGINCAFNNADVGNLTFDVLDLQGGVVDYRRRKVGKIRRVIPLRQETIAALRAYLRIRPQPASDEYTNHVFITRHGLPYVRDKIHTDEAGAIVKSTPINSISSEWSDLLDDAGVERQPGRGFSGLRTTAVALRPARSRDEIELILGHRMQEGERAQYSGSRVLERSYEEQIDLAPIREVINAIWHLAFLAPLPKGKAARGGAASKPKPAQAGVGEQSRGEERRSSSPSRGARPQRKLQARDVRHCLRHDKPSADAPRSGGG